MTEDTFIQGTPPMVFMPAKNYVFRPSKDHYIVKLPRTGKYHDIDPEFFTEEDGEFNLFDEETKVLFTPAITKVLFATKQYPELAFNQFFAPYSIKFEDDKVLIIGQIIDMMVKVDDDGNIDEGETDD